MPDRSPAEAPAPRGNTTIILLALAAFFSGAALRICDSLLPRLANDFGLTPGAAGRVILSFSIAYGLMQLVFGPNSDELAATIQLLTRSALQQWLGDLIRVEDVLAESIDSTLTIEVRYTRVLSQESTTVRFVRPV